jgi:hypothetical protein
MAPVMSDKFLRCSTMLYTDFGHYEENIPENIGFLVAFWHFPWNFSNFYVLPDNFP